MEQAVQTPRVICRLCKERLVTLARIAWSDYRCHHCRKQTPAYQVAEHKYRRSPKRMAAANARGPRRIWVGSEYHSTAKTVEEARRINAHVKARLNAFKGLQAREKVEGVA